MREKVTAARLQEFMKALGNAVVEPARIFLVGGATAVLCGWRDSTIDIDLKAIPDSDELLRNIPALAKIERGHHVDLRDVQRMIQDGLVKPERLLEFFSQIEEKIYKYPALDPKKFRAAVERVVRETERQ